MATNTFDTLRRARAMLEALTVQIRLQMPRLQNRTNKAELLTGVHTLVSTIQQHVVAVDGLLNSLPRDESSLPAIPAADQPAHPRGDDKMPAATVSTAQPAHPAATPTLQAATGRAGPTPDAGSCGDGNLALEPVAPPPRPSTVPPFVPAAALPLPPAAPAQATPALPLQEHPGPLPAANAANPPLHHSPADPPAPINPPGTATGPEPAPAQNEVVAALAEERAERTVLEVKMAHLEKRFRELGTRLTLYQECRAFLLAQIEELETERQQLHQQFAASQSTEQRQQQQIAELERQLRQGPDAPTTPTGLTAPRPREPRPA